MMQGLESASGHCPVCDVDVIEWQPFVRLVGNGKYRKEPGGRLCPHCGSFERTRHFWLYLLQQQVLDKKPRFLHVAPERGLRDRLRKLLESCYVTTDMNIPDVDYRTNLTALPFSDGSFDFIYCSNVLEHIPDDHKAMSELRRVLATGGIAYIQVPIQGDVTQEDPNVINPEECTRRFGQADHVRLYGHDIHDRLSHAGFNVQDLIMPDVLNLPTPQLKIFNCEKREIIHICRVR